MRRLLSPTTPNWQRHYALTPVRFRLIPFRSPLLRESLLLSFPRATEMFHFTLFPLPELCIHSGVTPHDRCRVSPFGRPRVKAWSAAHRGFSQPPASFIGSRRQGIRRWLFVAWKFLIWKKDARVRYAILKGRCGAGEVDHECSHQDSKRTQHGCIPSKRKRRRNDLALSPAMSKLEWRVFSTDQITSASTGMLEEIPP
jgi:hypothetical protein